MEIEFASKQQQELIEYLTPKLTEEELKHVVFLLYQHNCENYTVGYTKYSIQNTHPFFTTRECIEILDELDSEDWCWSKVQESLEEYLYTPPAYEKYLEELIKENFIPIIIWDNLWDKFNIDTEDIVDTVKEDLNQSIVYEYKQTGNLTYRQSIFRNIKDIIQNKILAEVTPKDLIDLLKEVESTEADYKAVSKFITDNYDMSNIDFTKLWQR